MKLVEYPWVVVRLRCRYCNRCGQYRLARLASKFGAEISLDDLLDRLAFDCPWRRDPADRHPGKYDVKCGAYFPDLDGAPPPSDIPPGAVGLRLIQGGKRSGVCHCSLGSSGRRPKGAKPLRLSSADIATDSCACHRSTARLILLPNEAYCGGYGGSGADRT